MNDTMTEGEFGKYLESMTAYGGSPKVVMVRCTCPRPKDCTCPEPDEEGSIDPCPACIAMVHTAPDCMIQVMTNWKLDKMKVAERELGMAVKSYCSEITMLEPGHVPPLPPGEPRKVEGWLP